MSGSQIPETVQRADDDQARRFIADICERGRSDWRELNERFAGLADDEDDGGRAGWAKDAAQLIGLWFDDETTRRCIERWANFTHDRLAETFGPQIAACVASPEARQGVMEPHPWSRNAYGHKRMVRRLGVQQQGDNPADDARDLEWHPTPPAALCEWLGQKAALETPEQSQRWVLTGWHQDPSGPITDQLRQEIVWRQAVALTERIHERLVAIQDEAFRIQADRWWRIVACYKRHRPGGDRHELRLVGYLPSLFDAENGGGSWPFQNTDLEAVHADLAAVVERASDAELPKDDHPGSEPLTPSARAVLELLGELPPNAALTGPEILTALDNKKPPILLDQSTLTSRIIPALKPHGVKNKPRVGYYLDRHALGG